MNTMGERNRRAAAYSYRCHRRRDQAANAAVQRLLICSCLLFVAALSAVWVLT